MSIDRYIQMQEQNRPQCSTIRVAAYCRVSTDHDDQVNSFESQKRFFSHYIRSNPRWTLHEVYADEGLSGTTTKNRESFHRMIESAQAGAFDFILTKEISRFARNTLDSIYYTRELKRWGVGVIFLNDGINTMDGDSELRLAILSSIAQEESRRTSQRVKWGQRRRMEQGVVFGRNMLGYDVQDGTMQVNEEGARVVRMIFRKFLEEGKGTGVIARELTEAGIRPMYAAHWHSSVILRILRNEKYCGDLVQKKTYTPDYLTHEKKYNCGQEAFVILPDHHCPIISKEDYQRANQMLDSRSNTPTGMPKHSDRAPFSGKIHCALCGSSYVLRQKQRKDGSVYRAWRCQKANHQGKPRLCPDGTATGCANRSISQDHINQILGRLLTQMLQTRPQAFQEIASSLRIQEDPAARSALERLFQGETVDEAFYASWVDEIQVGAQGLVEIRLLGHQEPLSFRRSTNNGRDLF